MGIPYYFASLIRHNKGIVSRIDRCLRPDIFAIDFNCFIHQYMKDEAPIESIVNALRELFQVCSATNYTYIAMDGMVPYAKMVQQRYRRFRIPEKEPVFDRHQISPETPYMKELYSAVTQAFPDAVISSTAEPGEGEHKMLNWLKKMPAIERRSIVVYGLDADLILLTLSQKRLSAPGSFHLLRETPSFGKAVPETGRACGEASHQRNLFSILSVWKLSETLEMPIDEYIRLCVLCFGNDFMPSLGMFSLREGGHERAMRIYKQNKCSLDTVEGRATFLKHAGKEELAFMLEKVHNPAERAVIALDGSYFRERYNAHILDGVQTDKKVAEAFWKTYHWTLNYFTNNVEIDWGWYYPYPDAPLVCQLNDHVEEPPTYTHVDTFTVTQQLQFILPSVSLRRAKKRVVYPDEYYNEETDVRIPWMKRYKWESKPRISLPNAIETKIELWGV